MYHKGYNHSANQNLFVLVGGSTWSKENFPFQYSSDRFKSKRARY